MTLPSCCAVIDERDAYMAHALWATATGRSGTSPAFVADSTHDGRTVFRYAMPAGGPGEALIHATLLEYSVDIPPDMTLGLHAKPAFST